MKTVLDTTTTRVTASARRPMMLVAELADTNRGRTVAAEPAILRCLRPHGFAAQKDDFVFVGGQLVGAPGF